MMVAVGLAGCGNAPDPGPKTSNAAEPPGKPAATPGKSLSAIDIADAIDACPMVTDAQLANLFGESPGEKSKNSGVYDAGCIYKDSSEVSYLALNVTVVPANQVKEMYDYGESVSDHVKPVGGLGEKAFSSYTSTEAKVETVNQGMIVTLTQIFYAQSTPVKELEASIAKLTALAGPVVARVGPRP